VTSCSLACRIVYVSTRVRCSGSICVREMFFANRSSLVFSCAQVRHVSLMASVLLSFDPGIGHVL
jgi:hypothetical protein